METLADLRARWMATVFDADRPQCLDADVALASISDTVAFYAVPFAQRPGFLSEIKDGTSSARKGIDQGLFGEHLQCEGMVAEEGVDYEVDGEWGAHMDHVPTPGECCSLCQASPKCRAWTWVRDAGLTVGSPSQCWLKSAVGTKAHEFFGSLDRTVLVLFQAMIGGISWKEALDALVAATTPIMGTSGEPGTSIPGFKQRAKVTPELVV